MSGTVVVLGAGGAIGSHVVDALVGQGRAVRAVTRRAGADRPGVESAVADVRDPAALRDTLRGADVVIHAVQPAYTRWHVEFPALTDAVADATAAEGARLVFADNLYGYGPVPGPLTEDLPSAATDRKGLLRAAMAQRLIRRHTAGELDVVIGRASDYYGPRGVLTVAGSTLFDAVVTGSTVRLIGSADQPHSWSYLPDIARALLLLADSSRASGEVWHLPVAAPLTQRELATIAAQAAGQPLRLSVLPGPVHRTLAVVHPMLRELWGTRYQLTAPFVVDHARFTREIAPFTPTPHAEALATTVAWFGDRRREVAAP